MVLSMAVNRWLMMLSTAAKRRFMTLVKSSKRRFMSPRMSSRRLWTSSMRFGELLGQCVQSRRRYVGGQAYPLSDTGFFRVQDRPAVDAVLRLDFLADTRNVVLGAAQGL